MGASAVTNHLIELDQHRGEDAQKATKTRRRLHEVQCDQAALKECQAEFERYLIVVPATTWPEAAARRGTSFNCSPTPPTLRTRAVTN